MAREMIAILDTLVALHFLLSTWLSLSRDLCGDLRETVI
jgi:hypothetical protein